MNSTAKNSSPARTTVGAVLATVGSLIAISGAGILGIAGSDGTIGSGQRDFSTSTSALVSDTADIEATNQIATAAGQPRIRIASRAQNAHDVFVGVGPARDVDRYLANVQVDRVTDVNVTPFHIDRTRERGTATPAAPAQQRFWSASASGKDATLDWKVRDGDYRFVVMNADGSAGVTTDSHVEVEVPYLSTIALAAMLAGFMTLAGGLIVLTVRRTAGERAA